MTFTIIILWPIVKRQLVLAYEVGLSLNLYFSMSVCIIRCTCPLMACNSKATDRRHYSWDPYTVSATLGASQLLLWCYGRCFRLVTTCLAGVNGPWNDPGPKLSLVAFRFWVDLRWSLSFENGSAGTRWCYGRACDICSTDCPAWNCTVTLCFRAKVLPCRWRVSLFRVSRNILSRKINRPTQGDIVRQTHRSHFLHAGPREWCWSVSCLLHK